jgi:hypothetical protein
MMLGPRLTGLSLLVALAGAVGCIDPQSDYNDFKQRYADDHGTSSSSAASSSSSSGSGGGGGGSCVPMAGTADGDYVIALSANLSPPNPLLLSGSLKTAEAGGALELTMTVQALDAKDRKTKVGNVITFPAAKVGSDGSFVFKPGNLTVDGNANPLIYGTAIETTGVTLTGNFCDPKFVCGNLDGMITKPIADDLSMTSMRPQSTWTMVPYDGKTAPAKIYIDCGMDVAGPPPT